MGAGRRQAGLTPGQLMKCFSTHNCRLQDVALGSGRVCYTVRGWAL